MEYNTVRTKLIIPEYGRHVQRMVNHCKTIEDKEERNGFAQIIIEVMGELNPHLRDVPDFQHKLWDQLFIMAEFDLDVDFPYDKPAKEIIDSKPNRVPYPQEDYKYKYYGRNIRRMIDVVINWEEGEKKEGLIYALANHMKKCYLIWNKDTVEDKVIFQHMRELSDGKINLKEDKETLVSSEKLNQPTTVGSGKKKHTKRKNNKR